MYQLTKWLLLISLIPQSIPEREICFPAGQKGEPGPPGKPGICDCDLSYGGDVKAQLDELNKTVHILREKLSYSKTSQDIKCVVPAPPIYGVIYSRSNIASYGESITVRCREGFEIAVREERKGVKEVIPICQGNGTWTKRIPTCKAITCPVPATPRLVTLSTRQKRMDVHASMTYNCRPGYKILGTDGIQERNVTCLKNGTWTDGPPTCEPLHCSVGLKDGRIRDEQISASSYYNSDWLPHYGRLDRQSPENRNGGTWLPGRNCKNVLNLQISPQLLLPLPVRNEWLMVDLIHPTYVTGVVTQGYPGALWWVTGYKISYGNSTEEMHTIQHDSKDMIFGANPYDGDGHSVNKFRNPVTAKLFKLTVDSYINSSPTLRMEYLTC